MELKEIKSNIYACMQEDKGFGWNNSGFVNLGGGLIIDTLYDLNHTRKMIELYSKIAQKPIKRLINTHHNGDHTWGNQLLIDNTEIIGHKLCAEEMEKEKIRNLPGFLQTTINKPKRFPEGMRYFIDQISEFDFSEVNITLPNNIIEDDLELDLDGFPCQIIYVGPAHTPGDLIVNLPEQKVLFAGDIVFWKCTPLGWIGTYEKWIEALELIKSLKPEVIIPGHGPLCNFDAVDTLIGYFNSVYTQSKKFFDDGLDMMEASKRINLGEYKDWTGPERLIFNVNRAYREFQGIGPWDKPINEIELISKGYELRSYWDENKNLLL
ncbi:MAG: MBL fold metallo-hydrolase [Promethearchaeota archaeon]|nr:MAG: MBL fold metallo-hydrolase [Candidatus Lokiarchaeota archaeon]